MAVYADLASPSSLWDYHPLDRSLLLVIIPWKAYYFSAFPGTRSLCFGSPFRLARRVLVDCLRDAVLSFFALEQESTQGQQAKGTTAVPLAV